MNDDDYSPRQNRRDREYERQYREWIDSLPEDERRNMERSGLSKPCVQRHGSGSAEKDIADSSLASHTPDIAALIDPDDDPCTASSMRDATEILRHLVADLLSEGNTRLTLECLAVALGLSAYNGESMTDVAKRHGITRAAVSKRCVDITRQLNIAPSRAMRSMKARETYRRSQLKRNRKSKP